LIKNREKNKIKLQIKSNRSNITFFYFKIILDELSFEDKQRFKNLTTDIYRKIKAFKDLHQFSIVWRGLEYQCVKFYI